MLSLDDDDKVLVEDIVGATVRDSMGGAEVPMVGKLV